MEGLVGEEAPSSLFLLEIETALERAVSFSTLFVRNSWNSSPKRVPGPALMVSEPNLVQELSIAPRICALLNCEVSSEAFPTRQTVCCTIVSTSEAGTVS